MDLALKLDKITLGYALKGGISISAVLLVSLTNFDFFKVIPYYIIDSYLLIFLSSLIAYTIFQVRDLKAIILNKVLNNVPVELDKILFELSKDIKNNTMAEEGFIRYLAKKLADVKGRYIYIRSLGNYNLVFDTDFEKWLMGNPENELRSFYTYTRNNEVCTYPDEFIQQVDGINRNCYRLLKEKILLEAQGAKGTDRIEIIKHNILRYFEKNVKDIIHLFNETKYQIKDPEFTAIYGREITITDFSKYNIKSKATVNTKDLITLLGKGKFGVENAVDILIKALETNDEYYNEIVHMNNLIYTFKTTPANSEKNEMAFNRLVGRLIEIIQEISKR